MEAGIVFHEKKGLLIPSATAKFIGLQVADVEERKVASTFHFAAQVYRSAKETRFASLQSTSAATALASGNVSSIDAAKLSEGQVVSIVVAGFADAFQGLVTGLTRGLEKASGQVEVLLAVLDPQQVLALGTTISVNAALGGDKSVVSVPRSALLRTAEGDFVYTVSGEHFVRTPVKVGAANEEYAEVTDGLYAGDQIVKQPAMTLWLTELQSLRGGKACADGH